MRASTRSLPPQQTRDHPWLASVVFALDSRLRKLHAVEEYSRRPDCIFRIQRGVADRPLAFAGGERVAQGAEIINLHLWNEQTPVLDGDSLRWARKMHSCIETSLIELAAHIAHSSEFDAIAAIGAEMTFGTPRQTEQLERLAAHFGFERLFDPATRSVRKNLRVLGENILISMMVLARNGAALRADSILRDRVGVFMSRKELMRRYESMTSNRRTERKNDSA